MCLEGRAVELRYLLRKRIPLGIALLHLLVQDREALSVY